MPGPTLGLPYTGRARHLCFGEPGGTQSKLLPTCGQNKGIALAPGPRLSAAACARRASCWPSPGAPSLRAKPVPPHGAPSTPSTGATSLQIPSGEYGRGAGAGRASLNKCTCTRNRGGGAAVGSPMPLVLARMQELVQRAGGAQEGVPQPLSPPSPSAGPAGWPGTDPRRGAAKPAGGIARAGATPALGRAWPPPWARAGCWPGSGTTVPRCW